MGILFIGVRKKIFSFLFHFFLTGGDFEKIKEKREKELRKYSRTRGTVYFLLGHVTSPKKLCDSSRIRWMALNGI